MRWVRLPIPYGGMLTVPVMLRLCTWVLVNLLQWFRSCSVDVSVSAISMVVMFALCV